LMGLIRSSRDVWQVGERYPYDDMEIQVQSLFKGKPQKILITLLRSDVRSYQWSYWDMSSSSYRLFPLPKVGESVRIEGIFSDKFLE